MSKSLTQMCADVVAEKDRQISNLQSQLEEKEKEIEDRMMAFEKRCQEYYKSNEYKIDFAIEQLEKVKEFVNEIYGEYSASVTTNFIDNQIEGLKKEMK